MELVVSRNGDPVVKVAGGNRLGALHQGEDRPDERTSPVVPEGHGCEQRECDDHEELQLQLVSQRVCLCCRLLDDDRPVRRWDWGGHTQ